MKKTILLLSLFSVFSFISISFAQNPTYELTARNFSFNCGVYNQIEWDIYMFRTGNVPLEFAGGSFVLKYNTAILQGGSRSFTIVNSELPEGLQPIASSGSNELRVNSFLTEKDGYFISNTYPGTKIARVRLMTTATSFIAFNTLPEENEMDIRFNNSSPGSVTFVIAIMLGEFVNITDSTNTFVVPNYYGMFIWMTMPWDGCNGRPFNFFCAPEGLYNSSLNKLNRKDTVTMEFCDLSYPYDAVSSFKSVLDSNTISTFTVGTTPHFLNNNFYVVVKHRNSIETWSKAGVFFGRGGVVSVVRFIDSAGSAYGSNLKQVGSKYLMYSGDVNQDGAINLTDVTSIYNDSVEELTGYNNTDLNGDRVVNLADLIIAYNNAVGFVSVKKPL